MITIFENLFAVYYRLMVAQRNFWRKLVLGIIVTRNEDVDTAACLVIVQVLFISVIVGWIIKGLRLHISSWYIFLLLPCFYYLTYLNNKVFAKNREKRRIILDNYNNHSEIKKSAWIIFSILVIIIPIYLITVLVQ